MNYESAMTLRQRADAAFEAANSMLRVAQHLLTQGNQREAARLRNEAREKRNESVLLMDKARVVEAGQSNVLQFRPRNNPLVKLEEDARVTTGERRRFRSGETGSLS